MSDTGQETHMPIKSDFSNVTDYLRMVIGGISSRVTPTVLASKIAVLIEASTTDSYVRSVTGSDLIALTDNTVICDTTSGNLTLILPEPASAFNFSTNKSKRFTITQAISAGNSVIVQNYSVESIFVNGIGNSSVELTDGAYISLETDGFNWYNVGS